MKQSNLAIILLFLSFLFSCKSAKELAMDGKYNKAFNKAAGDLKKQSSNVELLEVLKLSFDRANEEDLNKINQLEYKNSPDRWDNVAKLYQSLQERHDKMRQILPFLSSTAQSDIRTFNYNFQITNALKNAADYKFSKGLSLLDMNRKSKAREAFDYFKQVKKYDVAYPEIDELIDEAKFMGTNHVLFLVNDYTSQYLPQNFLMGIAEAGNDLSLNSSWINYYTVSRNNFDYDYVIRLDLNYIRSTPERVNTRSSVYTKTIDDGWEYERDRRGNIMKDANGNDIKRKKAREIRCELLETTQAKSVFIDATLNYVYGRTNRIVRSIPIALEQPYTYKYVTIKGDRAALQGQVLPERLINNRPQPFPSTIDLVFMSQERLCRMVYTALLDNNRLIMNND